MLLGLIMALMVLMALDHTRDFVFGFSPSPTDLDATTPMLFATRWIAHVCAPGFLLLAGASAALQRGRRRPGALAWFLLTRGAFLVALELTVVTFGWIPYPGRSLVLLQVIWAIGWSMIFIAPLVFLPIGVVAGLGVAVALGHPIVSEILQSATVAAWARVILLGANQVLTWGETTYDDVYRVLSDLALVWRDGRRVRGRCSDRRAARGLASVWLWLFCACAGVVWLWIPNPGSLTAAGHGPSCHS